MDIGNKIKQLRTRQGLTLEELASRSELTKGFLSQLERDHALHLDTEFKEIASNAWST